MSLRFGVRPPGLGREEKGQTKEMAGTMVQSLPREFFFDPAAIQADDSSEKVIFLIFIDLMVEMC